MCALRVPKAATPSESYWLGYRAGVPNNDFLQYGAYLLWERPGESQEWLLDSTPSSAEGPTDAPIGIGKTYFDAQADIHITPVAKGGSGADSWLDVRRSFFQNTFLIVGKSGSIRQSDPFSAPPAGGYAAWLEAWFGENPPLSAPGEVFDGDGYPNLMEYAAGTDPKAWTAASLFVAEIVNGRLHLWFEKDPAIEDVSVTAQQSGDLINWIANGFTPVRSDTSGLEVLLSTPVHLTPGGRSFVRWRFDLR